MALKKTDLERLRAASLADRLRKSPPPERYAQGSHQLTRKEQRERDRAQGLVPFAVKLPLNEVVAELLERGLEE